MKMSKVRTHNFALLLIMHFVAIIIISILIIVVCVLLINPVLPAFPAFLFGLAHSCRLLLFPCPLPRLSSLAEDDDAFFCVLVLILIFVWFAFFSSCLGLFGDVVLVFLLIFPVWCRHRSVPVPLFLGQEQIFPFRRHLEVFFSWSQNKSWHWNFNWIGNENKRESSAGISI